MMRRLKIAETLDKHLGQHHLHEGLSNGNLAVGWLAYILSESDHRKSAVEKWANRIPHSLDTFLPPRCGRTSSATIGLASS
jgi:transposase